MGASCPRDAAGRDAAGRDDGGDEKRGASEGREERRAEEAMVVLRCVGWNGERRDVARCGCGRGADTAGDGARALVADVGERAVAELGFGEEGGDEGANVDGGEPEPG